MSPPGALRRSRFGAGRDRKARPAPRVLAKSDPGPEIPRSISVLHSETPSERIGMPRPASHPHRSSLPIALTLVLAISAASAHAEPPSTALPELTTELAFPNLKFARPVTLAYPDDGRNLLFV